MKVLLALDETPYSQHMLDLVCHRRWAPDTEFKIVHVIEPLKEADWAGDGWAAMHHELKQRRHKYAEKLMSDARHKLEKNVPTSIVHFEVREGSPQAEILAAATDWEANKVLLGAHSREICPHNFIGSVSRRVVENSPCSVEVVRSHSAPKAARELQASSASKAKKS